MPRKKQRIRRTASGGYAINPKKKTSRNPIWIPTTDKTGKKTARRVPTWDEFTKPGTVESEAFFSANPGGNMNRRGAIMIAPRVLKLLTDTHSYDVKNPVLLLGLADGSILLRGYRGPKPSGRLKAIIYEDRAKAARESQALDRPWKHDVKSATMAHLTRQGLLVTSREAPLWGIS